MATDLMMRVSVGLNEVGGACDLRRLVQLSNYQMLSFESLGVLSKATTCAVRS